MRIKREDRNDYIPCPLMPYMPSTSVTAFSIACNVIDGYYDALNRSDPEAAARLVGLDPTDDSIWLRLRGGSPSADA